MLQTEDTVFGARKGPAHLGPTHIIKASSDYSVKPTFSMWRLSVGVIADPVTFLFIR
jgi:hypothetical protein